MLTIFSIPKAFNGHIGDIQRNAINSWTRLQPECEILLLGDDEGTGKAADENGALDSSIGILRRVKNLKSMVPARRG